MTEQKDLKNHIRERMSKTGEAFTTARRHVLSEANADPRASARALVQRAMEREPRLTTYGLGVFDQKRRSATAVGEEFDKRRAQLTSEMVLDQVETCADWLRLQKQTKTLNPNSNSYSYKHNVENWAYRVLRREQYIFEGALIAAALGLGFDYKPTESGSTNVRLNLSWRQLKIVQAQGSW